jgi:pimeloyl-ACP methyl ester carboxylesterase
MDVGMLATREIRGIRISCWINDAEFVQNRRSLVFIHGSGRDHTFWKNQCEVLQDQFNILALSLPGHGLSEGKGEQDVSSYVEWVRDILVDFDIHRPVLIGHSLGAAISLAFAILYGDMLSGIVAVGGGSKMPVNPVILEGILNDIEATAPKIAKYGLAKENHERYARFLIDGLIKSNPVVVYGDFLACNCFDITKNVSSIRIPTLLICGAEDKLTQPSLSQFILEQIPTARLSLIEKAGHYPMLENASAFNKAITDFMESIRRR